MKRLTINQIININRAVVDRFGGEHRLLNCGLLEQSINSPFQTFDGTDLYTTHYEKAAHFCYNLIKNHCFADGNKRTALIAFLTFLELNDYPTHNQDWIILYYLIYDVADGSKNVDSIITWLYYFT